MSLFCHLFRRPRGRRGRPQLLTKLVRVARKMPQLRRQAPVQLGVVLLLYQIFAGVGLRNIPPVTLASVALQVAIFLGYVDPGWGPHSRVCLSASAILQTGDYSRMLIAPLEHSTDLHLYYNMVSLIWKGRLLERRFGSAKFAFLLVLFMMLTGVIYVALAVAAAEYFHDTSYLHQCAVGFSGVLFALKVLVNHYERNQNERASVFGFDLPIRLAVWAELLLIQLLVPNASFIGHLAGIISGVIYVNGLSSVKFVFSPVAFAFSHPVTISSSVVLGALHFNLFEKPWPTRHLWSSGSSLVCLNARTVLEKRDYIRVLSAPVEHASDIHFAMCLFSFAIKGYKIEKSRGSLSFLFATVWSIIGTSLLYILFSAIVFKVTSDPMYFTECVQGLTGALFALKVICLADADSFLSPTCLFEIFELLILREERTQLLHLSGLTAGFVWIYFRSKKFPGLGRVLGHHSVNETRPASALRTRSWGYANYQQYPVIASRTNFHDQSSVDRSASLSTSRSAFGSPFSQTSLDSSNMAHSSLDSEVDDEAIPMRRRSERSLTPSPSAPPYNTEWDTIQHPPPSYASANDPPPPPSGLYYHRDLQSPVSDDASSSPDIEDVRRRRLQRFSTTS